MAAPLQPSPHPHRPRRSPACQSRHQPVRAVQLAVATFTVAIGNADAHGKNLSLLHTAPGVIELAPLYDTVPTALWPKLDTAAAMTVNNVPTLAAVTGADLRAEAARWKLDQDSVETVLTDTLTQLAAAAVGPDVPPALAAHVQGRCAELAG